MDRLPQWIYDERNCNICGLEQLRFKQPHKGNFWLTDPGSDHVRRHDSMPPCTPSIHHLALAYLKKQSPNP